MNKILLANLCILVMIGAIIAAITGSITWGTVGLIFMGTFAVCILNGLIIGLILRKYR